MLNLNLSLLTLTFLFFLLVSYYFVFFKYSMISFFVALVRSRKRMQKYYRFHYPPNFLITFFQKNFTFSVTPLLSGEYFFIIFYLFLTSFGKNLFFDHFEENFALPFFMIFFAIFEKMG